MSGEFVAGPTALRTSVCTCDHAVASHGPEGCHGRNSLYVPMRPCDCRRNAIAALLTSGVVQPIDAAARAGDPLFGGEGGVGVEEVKVQAKIWHRAASFVRNFDQNQAGWSRTFDLETCRALAEGLDRAGDSAQERAATLARPSPALTPERRAELAEALHRRVVTHRAPLNGQGIPPVSADRSPAEYAEQPREDAVREAQAEAWSKGRHEEVEYRESRRRGWPVRAPLNPYLARPTNDGTPGGAT